MCLPPTLSTHLDDRPLHVLLSLLRDPEANAKRKRLNEPTHKQRGTGNLHISLRGLQSVTIRKRFSQFSPQNLTPL